MLHTVQEHIHNVIQYQTFNDYELFFTITI